MAQQKLDSVKTYFTNSKQKFNQRMTMEGILKQARCSFEQFLNPKIVPIEQRISDKLMRYFLCYNNHGIIIINIIIMYIC